MQHIAIIGAGFSGIATALHLQARATHPLSIHLIDGHKPGGVAYHPADTSSLLNVSAGRMGIWDQHPQHFLKWLHTCGVNADADAFVSRSQYGEYLAVQLAEGLKEQGPGRLFFYPAEVTSFQVTSCSTDQTSFVLTLSNGQRIQGDQCVLALGNFPPAPLPLLTPHFCHHPLYFGNPWAADAIENIPEQAKILIIGTGLTAVDCVLALRNRKHQGRIIMVSSHGKFPPKQEPIVKDALPVFGLKPGDNLATIVQQIRLELRHMSPHQPPSSSHYQAVATALRPLFSSLWQDLSLSQQHQFLRHGMHIWNQMRHRLPPQVALQLDDLCRSGYLQLIAGRVIDLREQFDGISLDYRLRGGTEPLRLTGFQRVINATGPCLDYTQVHSPLLSDLFSQGLVVGHPLKLGLQALTNGQLLNKENQKVPGLFALGPALRGVLWECTAVPEIRQQASALAKHLLTR